MAEVVYVALGSTLGDRECYLASARAAIGALPRTTVVALSDVDETEPIGPAGQGNYLNQMLAILTELEPEELLHELQRIATENGRVRGARWGPRTLDLDIVRYGDRRVDTPGLRLPHPELPHRDFWARQLAELQAR